MNCFIQNKPNLLNAQININKVLTKDYENQRLCTRTENKPNQTHLVPVVKERTSGRRQTNEKSEK